MNLESLLSHLNSKFETPLSEAGENFWRHTWDSGELILMLSEDQSWVRMMIPIASMTQAQPFFQELLELNFEETTLVRYAIAHGMLWGVFNHPMETLQVKDIELAFNCLLTLQQQGVTRCFDVHADRQVRLIIQASKRQGLSLKATLQNLERFYREGIIGDLSDSGATIQLTLTRWRDRLERLWADVH